MPGDPEYDRTKIFVSHANPEDNDFARWITLRLAAQGYPVWCDLTDLLGGETFWKDVEAAIRQRTVKFLYVLSRTSNEKDGPRRELRIAENVQRKHKLKDFIIPLRIDDLPFSDVNIELADKTVVDFSKGWASGLTQLTAKLEKDGVARNAAYSPSAVAEWWSQFAKAAEGVGDQIDLYLSNWFPITITPNRLWLHRVQGFFADRNREVPDASYPALGLKRFVLSFAGASDVARFAGGLRVTESQSFAPLEFAVPLEHDPLGGVAQRQRLLSWLLRLAWERFAASRGLKPYQLTRGKAFVFTRRLLGTDRVGFYDSDEKWHTRALVGFRTVKRPSGEEAKRHWHFGVAAQPLLEPRLLYALQYHVAFSDDGEMLWEQPSRSHRARRRIGRNWWNGEWRDRLLAAINWLSEEEGIRIAVGANVSLVFPKVPWVFESPVSYMPTDRAIHDAQPPAAEEEETEEEEEWLDEGGTEKGEND